MQEDGMSFDAALKIAQQKGFAEADPTFDVEGFDAGHKISILSSIAYNKKINYRSVTIEGITKISDQDINYAKEMGYVIKLLGISKLVGEEVDIRVHPTMIHQRHPLASVINEFNAIMIISDMTGPIMLQGRGAGGHPTASAVVSDIVQIAQMGKLPENFAVEMEEAVYLPPANRLSRYYIRMQTEDRPGILSKISGVLGKNNISIASVIQKQGKSEYVPLVIMTHKVFEDEMFSAVDELNNYDFINGKISIIRVVDYFNIGESK
jgi:homoserine dehydrogenase